MRLFSKRFGRYVAVFEPAEATLLSDLVDQVRQMLAGRRAESSVDPLAKVTGMALAPGTPPDDPALARLLPDFHAADTELSAGLRMLRDSLPRGGGTVHLDGEVATAWIRALNDVRLALGVRLGITDDEFELPTGIDPEGVQSAIFATYRWLSAVQDSLVTVLLD